MSVQEMQPRQSGYEYSWRKRTRLDNSGSGEAAFKKPRTCYNIILESDSAPETDEDNESIHSVQGEETEYVRDTSDTDGSGTDYVMELEYEVDSDYDNDEDFVITEDSSSGTEDIVEAAAGLIAAAICDVDPGLWADTEDSLSGASDVPDSELSTADFWTCVQCKNANNNPMFRYCEKCYQVRKNFFPPRPKAHKRKQPPRKKSVSEDSEKNVCQALSQDSGFGASQTQELDDDLLETHSILRPLHSVERGDSKSSEIKQIQVSCSENRLEDPVNSISTQTEFSIAEYSKNCSLNSDSGMCITCTTNPKDAVFIHSGIMHICCCYKCAVKVWNQTKQCPICKKKISNVRKVCLM